MSLIYSKTGRVRSPSLALTTTAMATLTAMTAGLVLAMYRGGYHQRLVRFLRTIPPKIYDVVILNMTEVWYRTVFSRLPDGTAVLDVGIGTGGALCRCADLVRSKQLRIIGLDYDAAYVDAARQSIADVGLQDQVRVVCMSVYDEEKLYRLGDVLDRMNGASGGDADKKIEAMAQAAAARATRPRKAFAAVYFSGSFSLLPDPPAALRLASKVLADHGKIYITQTFQRRTLPLLNVIKPWIYFVTSIDFGQLISTSKIIDLYKEVEEDLELESHTPIEGSVDTVLQGAYMSVLRHSAEEDAI